MWYTHFHLKILERFSRAGPRGRGREWATLGVHPLSCLLSNNRLEKVPFVSVLHTSSNRLLLNNQDKGCTPSVYHSLPLPLGPALLNLWNDNATNAHVKGYLEPALLKSSPLFTISKKLLGQDSPSVHLFFYNNWVKIHCYENKVGWRFTKLICFFLVKIHFQKNKIIKQNTCSFKIHHASNFAR